ncbi:MAG: RagB/SusD family nutrient uptake outer membrane protein [Bacteroidota bacterium]
MKKIYFKCLILIISITVFSCKKALDTKPTDFISSATWYNNAKEMDAALNGVYYNLSRGNMYQEFGSSLFTNFNCVDEAVILSNTVNISQKFDYNSSYADIANLWRTLYNGIEIANNLLANIDKPQDMDQASRDAVKGQAEFLRAYYYFLLVSNWGDVPLKLTPTASVNDINYPRTPAKEVYAQIVKDMIEAESLVRPISYYGATGSGRITKSAVQGILARVYLYWAGYPNNDPSKYAESLKWSTKLIQSGLHSLNPDYQQIFINLIQDKYDIKESIWEVEFYTTGVGDVKAKQGAIGSSYYSITQSNIANGYSGGAAGAMGSQFNKYEPNDARRDWCIASYSYLGNNTLTKVYWTPSQIYERRIGKFRREYELTAAKVANYTPTNFPVLRYSDVLLMAAEAENEVNGPNNAYQYVNMVRKRAYAKDLNGQTIKTVNVTNGGTGYTTAPTVTVTGGGATTQATAVANLTSGKVSSISIVSYGKFYTSTPTVTITGGGGSGATATATISQVNDELLSSVQIADKNSLRQAIQDERLRELCFEGLRRNDLIRWGMLVSSVQAVSNDIKLNAPAAYQTAAVAGTNINDNYNLFPIPQREITLVPLLTQNPGF